MPNKKCLFEYFKRISSFLIGFFFVNRLRTTGNASIQHPKMCKVWFYEDIQHMRNKINLLNVNETASKLFYDHRKIDIKGSIIGKQRMKFVFSIIKKQIPEKYNIDIEIPKNKHKSYIELTDGSIQV